MAAGLPVGVLALAPVMLLLQCQPAARHEAEPPQLAVVIVVDQLRADLLDRYDALFVGGFRRLRDHGLRFNEARVDHAITVSHPGHVTIATGLHPAHHGIVDAAFYELDGSTWRFVDAVRDSTAQILGVEGAPGASPHKIIASALPDWFTAADSSARVVALGSGQHSSLLHGGKGHPDVYWYSTAAGRYVTSSHYRRDYPPWLDEFNARRLPAFIREAADWESTVPPAARVLARPDSAVYEGDRVHVAFPHRLADVLPARAGDHSAMARWMAATPMLDAATLALAEEAVCARSLGQRAATDYLSIVVSQVDDIGHSYGPLSQEQLDNLLRLDRALGRFFDLLDATVGADRWTVALTADHGVPDIPEYQRETGRRARRVPQSVVDTILGKVREVVARSRGSRDETARQVVALLEHEDNVADAMTPAELMATGAPNDSFVVLYRHSYRPDRVPRYPLFSFQDGTSVVAAAGVAVRLVEGDMLDLDAAVHGSPYEYDRRVPIIFMGPGIPAGISRAVARTVDVAPTLAALAGVRAPDRLDGRVLALAAQDGVPSRRSGR